MIRRNHSNSLARGYQTSEDEDINPNSYIVNLADCMLVVAVGLLVALVAHYGVDLQAPEDMLTATEVILDEDSDGEIDENFKASGQVYYDKESGKYYMAKK